MATRRTDRPGPFLAPPGHRLTVAPVPIVDDRERRSR